MTGLNLGTRMRPKRPGCSLKLLHPGDSEPCLHPPDPSRYDPALGPPHSDSDPRGVKIIAAWEELLTTEQNPMRDALKGLKCPIQRIPEALQDFYISVYPSYIEETGGEDSAKRPAAFWDAEGAERIWPEPIYLALCTWARAYNLVDATGHVPFSFLPHYAETLRTWQLHPETTMSGWLTGGLVAQFRG